MKTRVFNLIILDESGSMQSIKKQAVNGFNETIQTIRSAQKENDSQEHFVSFVTFNSDGIKTKLDRIPAAEAHEIDANQFIPACCTPLFDAMGISLNYMRTKVADNDHVLVTVITDGEENSSHEYNGKAIKSLVEELKAKGWVFAYIGANQDVEKVAASMAIGNAMSFDATEVGTCEMSDKLNTSRRRLFSKWHRGDFNAAEDNESFFDED